MPIKAVISATSKEEAEKIADRLVEEGLVAGTLIVDGDSRYRWKGEIVNETYYNIQSYTLEKHKQEIIETVQELHSDETPIIEYTEIDGNQDFLDWIMENVG
ncbi:MAG: divalent-cation tolerance protein CutA [Candidatus Aenigmatarchaeota archaeon]